MLTIENFPVTAFEQNCRIVFDSDASDCCIVDPGGEAERILKKVDELGKQISQIWLTHSHLDHCGGVADLIEKTAATLVGHKEGQIMRSKVVDICAMYGMPAGDMRNCPEPQTYIDEGDIVEISEHRFKTFFTPGHSPDHVVFYNKENNVLLAGDTVFAGSIGRTDLPGGHHQTLLKSIHDKILTLPPETRILCGHGPDTNIETEKKSNPFLV